VDLKAGEIECPKCNGTGHDVEDKKHFYIWCEKCQGSGKVNWIEAIVGKKKSSEFSIIDYSWNPYILHDQKLMITTNVA